MALRSKTWQALCGTKSQLAPSSKTNIVLLSLTYFLYFGQLGIIVPYLSVFLDSRGYNSQQIGHLTAIILLTRVAGPFMWASIADKQDNGAQLLRFGCLTASVTFLFVFISFEFWSLALTIGLMMMFWTAVLPQLEVLTVRSLASSTLSYGRVRLWGSVGYIASAIVVGSLVDHYGAFIIVVCSATVLVMLYLSSLSIANAQEKTVPQITKQPQRSTLFAPTFIFFILSAFCLQVSFGPFYSFFALYMKDLGYTGLETGIFIAIGVLAEVGIFIIADKLIRRFGVKRVLLYSLFFTAIRWIIMAMFAQYLGAILISQIIHALSFGMTHAASIYFIHHYFSRYFQSRGQAIYVSASFGLGGALGSYITGILWQQGEGAQASFVFAAIFASIAGVLIMLIRNKQIDAAFAKKLAHEQS